ncbi:MAG TPA: GNAT family N-acetyltransferase [Sediminibacterium sp.]|nr:GNAT family N-acetyltransferase [Sediminibacterium sp.]
MQFEWTGKNADFRQILALQKENLISAVSDPSEGFVTLEMDESSLDAMRGPYQHVIAREGEKLAGYALVMLPGYADSFPLLDPMIRFIRQAYYQDQRVAELRYFIMGQICVAADFRQQGVFRELYRQLRTQMQSGFDLVITEVSRANPRSLQGHKAVGFRSLRIPGQPAAADWDIIGWNWQ